MNATMLSTFEQLYIKPEKKFLEKRFDGAKEKTAFDVLDAVIVEIEKRDDSTPEQKQATLAILRKLKYTNRRQRLWYCTACGHVFCRNYGRKKWKKYQQADGKYKCLLCGTGTLRFLGVRQPGADAYIDNMDTQRYQIATLVEMSEPHSTMERKFRGLEFELNVRGKWKEIQKRLDMWWNIAQEKQNIS